MFACRRARRFLPGSFRLHRAQAGVGVEPAGPAGTTAAARRALLPACVTPRSRAFEMMTASSRLLTASMSALVDEGWMIDAPPSMPRIKAPCSAVSPWLVFTASRRCCRSRFDRRGGASLCCRCLSCGGGWRPSAGVVPGCRRLGISASVTSIRISACGGQAKNGVAPTNHAGRCVARNSDRRPWPAAAWRTRSCSAFSRESPDGATMCNGVCPGRLGSILVEQDPWRGLTAVGRHINAVLLPGAAQDLHTRGEQHLRCRRRRPAPEQQRRDPARRAHVRAGRDQRPTTST